jgi:predicted PurR-regulated permease PerM
MEAVKAPLPDHGPGSRVRRIVFLAVAGALLLGVLYAFREVLAPFALAMVVAYVFAPVVEGMERARIGGRRPPRWLAVLSLYLTLLGTMAAGLAVGVPLLVGQVQQLARDAPRTLATVQTEWLPAIDQRLRAIGGSIGDADESGDSAPPDGPTDISHAPAQTIRVTPVEGGGFEVILPADGIVVSQEDEHRFVIRAAEAETEQPRRDLATTVSDTIQRQLRESQASVGTAVQTLQSFVAATVNGIFKFFIMLMLSAYMLISSEAILGFFRTLISPARRTQFDTLLRRMDRGLSGVVRGQLVICVVNGILSAIGFWAIGLNYWPILALVATVLSIIPIFGAILSSVPAVVVGLQQGFGIALGTLVWIIVIHQIEANLLNPKIMGDAAKVHPVLVVFSLIAGEHFFGILGALLAVPVLSIAQTLFLYFREVSLGEAASATTSGVGQIPAPSMEPTLTPDEPPADG